MAGVTINPESTDPRELSSLGLRALYTRDYDAAVRAYSKAIELLVAAHGDKHEPLGEIYLNYGRALLELEREAVEPLGDAAVPKNLDEDDSDEEDEADTADSVSNKPETKPEQAKTNGTGEGGDGEKASAGPSSTNDTTKPNEEGDSTEDVAEEDATDLQVAWEVLELAKLIFENQGEKGQMSLAETLILLGEVSLESDNFEAAINDMKRGVELQKSLLPDDSRILAQSYYKLGIAYSTNAQLDDAIKSFEQSLDILRKKIKMLNETDEENKERFEIKEMEELIPEIEEKIVDMKSLKEEAIKKITSATASAKLSSPSKSNDGSTKVNDISHLVKRKRKLEDVIEEKNKQSETPPVKKPTP